MIRIVSKLSKSQLRASILFSSLGQSWKATTSSRQFWHQEKTVEIFRRQWDSVKTKEVLCSSPLYSCDLVCWLSGWYELEGGRCGAGLLEGLNRRQPFSSPSVSDEKGSVSVCPCIINLVIKPRWEHSPRRIFSWNIKRKYVFSKLIQPPTLSCCLFYLADQALDNFSMNVMLWYPTKISIGIRKKVTIF